MGGAGDGERLAEAAWASGESGWRSAGGQAAVLGHDWLAPQRFEGANENCSCPALGFAGDVDAVIHAVN